ncbi:MAG: Sua5/YciO/YrdC/YwlC family protein [Pseudomonadota bacterium]
MAKIHLPLRTALLLRAGGVIGYPTEGVYGLGCDPRHEDALEYLLDIKGRDADKGLILLADTRARLKAWVSPAALARIPPQPGARATTWIVPASATCSTLLTGGRATLAVRISSHPVAAALAAMLGAPIVSTSANLSGRPAITRAAVLRRQFGPALDAIIARPTGGERGPSRIIDAATGTVLRD